jgi:hypothetical protein
MRKKELGEVFLNVLKKDTSMKIDDVHGGPFKIIYTCKRLLRKF